jgi:hypothetical protein
LGLERSKEPAEDLGVAGGLGQAVEGRRWPLVIGRLARGEHQAGDSPRDSTFVPGEGDLRVGAMTAEIAIRELDAGRRLPAARRSLRRFLGADQL